LAGLEVEYVIKNDQKIDYYISQLAKKEMTDSENMDFLYWNIRVLLDRDKLDDVDSLLEKLLSYSKYNPKYYLLKGKAEISKGNKEEGIKALESALEYDLDSSVTQEASTLLSNTK
jgi:predicted negative regulator of RcsB-dependent stress response